ncbi:trypsin-1-like [Eurosta solidaginis]|uniref:trypsin-1-like n=1 Tax=Eurosta solidaginis TaxID=178769 RepID=UPI00353143CA
MNLKNYFAILSVVLSCVSTITKSQNRIIGGSDCDIKNSPYVVAVHINNNYRCMGTLITWRKVLTNANSLRGYTESSITVKAGRTDLRKAKTERKAKRIIHQCEFDRNMVVQMDLAVIMLKERLADSSSIQTIPFCEAALTPGVKLRVSSWGSKTGKDLEVSHILQSAEYEVVPIDECRARYAAEGNYLPTTVICLIDRAQASDASYGDAGAPAVKDGKLCAVMTEFAIDCQEL